MKNNNIKIKILLSLILLVILSAVTYISLPYISYALESAKNEFLETVGKITVPANSAEVKNQIHEHRGYSLIAPGATPTEAATYENAAGHTGISDIDAVLSEYLNDAYDWSLGWYFSLQKNTSIFCQERGVPFPNLNNKYLKRFHGGNVDTNEMHVGDKEIDYIELWSELACTHNPITALEEDYPDDGIVPKTTTVYEKDIIEAGTIRKMVKYYQFTLVRVDYKASARTFNTIESYIFTYSLRNWYTYNPAQAALWQYKNGSTYGGAVESGMRLYRAAMAVNELTSPTKPAMSATTDNTLAKNTGTVIDGDNYKVGPIYMNNYSYAYSEDVKEFSGQSSLDNPANAEMLSRMTEEQKAVFQGMICGIVEAKVELDNGTIIYLNKDNITYSEQDTSQTTFKNTYYESPSLHGYDFPTPNSKFYINLPIADCVGATSVKKITMKYKWHTADGNGGDLNGVYDELTWENSWDSGAAFDHATYHCDNSYDGYDCVNDNIKWSDRSCFPGDSGHTNVNNNAHVFWCGTDGYCFDGESGDHRHCEEECKECYGHEGSLICDCHTSHDYACRDYYCGHECDEDCIIDEETGDCKHYNSCDDDCDYDYSDCSYGGTVSHDDWVNRYNTGCYSTDYCDYADLNYCIHGHVDGEHKGSCETWGTSHIDQCYGPDGVGTRCNLHPDAGGGHRNCYEFKWEVTKETEDIHSQKLMYVSDAQVYEHNVECYLENIPLVAKVEIDKYIYDVEHAKTVDGVSDNSFGPSEARRDLDEATKEDNPVYVETDDFVTYKIIMKNSSAFGVKIRIDDILPDDTAYKFISANVGGTEITDIKELRDKIISIAATSEASVTVTIQVKALEGEHENKARIITRNGTPKNNDDDVDYIRTVDDDGPVVNHIETTCQGNTDTPEWESSDWFILNNYNTFIDKYLYKYDEKIQNDNNSTSLTDEETIVDSDDVLLESRVNNNKATEKVSDGNVEDTVRKIETIEDTDGMVMSKDDKNKKDHPVNVEKYETITYAIRVSNEATDVTKNEATGIKPGTQFKVTEVEDKLHNGLKYDSITAKIFNKDGSVKVADVLGVGCSSAGTDGDYNIYKLTTSNTTVINPGEYIEFYMQVSVVQSNMYLHTMDNSAKLIKISNINDVDVTERNISEQKETREFVRLKDLVISGRVWVDINKDGLIGGDAPRSEFEKSNHKLNNEGLKADVLVKLYQVGKDEPIRTTRTNASGLYTFARDENLSYYDTFNHLSSYSGDTKYQRIDKADGKDSNGNYTASSKYYSYYVEFEYDGIIYKSTVYADMDNLTGDGKYNTEYTIDSNAAELTQDREEFNEKYEYISYNVAYGYDAANDTYNLGQSANLDFEKEDHASYLIEDSSRAMTAKSFITLSSQTIKYLWLYPFSTGDRMLPETDYLKYINLGLELREDVDLALTKDVYSLKTTINGEEMEYDYNLGDTTDYLNDYVVKKPYGFEIYESDYKYRVEQYISEAVEIYKGLNEADPDQKFGTDELNVEVTYRINIQNVATTDDDLVANAGNELLNVKVHEVLDLYDENFLEYTEDLITVKVKDSEGFLKDKQVKVAEAWMFMKEDQAINEGKEAFIVKDEETNENITYKTRNSNGGSKPIYVADEAGEYVKVKLELSNTSTFANRTIDAESDGYNKVYISGMGDQVIPEGGDFDIYVKYTLDKADLQIEVDETYNETQTSSVRVYNESSKIIETQTIENDNISGTIYNVVEKERTVEDGSTEKYIEATIKRAIRLAEQTDNGFKSAEKGGRGTENIAQINAYSVWYQDGKPASLVDKDSNAGNIGVTPSGGETSVDNTDFYEDMTYKTGIEIIADKTENTKDKLEDKYHKDEEYVNEHGRIEITTTAEPIRKITGTVWDDSRSEVLTEADTITNIQDVYDAQYIGDGMYNALDAAGNLKGAYSSLNEKGELEILPKLNEALPKLYQLDANGDGNIDTEEYDLPVRNAKAEFIEIVQTDENHYYEEILTHVPWNQKQSARTDDTGYYELEGFKPGHYIVRFTYGDTIDENSYNVASPADISKEQNDMLVFNGQDYKSTQYTGVPDTLDDVDAVIQAFEKAGVSDARDDEARRLEVNAYSEVMTNETAEILKGKANGIPELTPSSKANTLEELKVLTDKTYMTADTREFLIKAEKLTTSQTIEYIGGDGTGIYYNALEALMNNHINQRTFTINHVDLGVEYRPESQISLMKEIKQITLTTEDKEVLVDLHFETIKDGKDREHQIVKDKSTGYELVQFVTNNYSTKSLINNIVSEEYVQGLVYIQVDEELLQGCTVEITYGFEAQNSSEVDRISQRLDDIRYRDNEATLKLIDAYKAKYGSQKPELLLDFSNVINSKYTASALARAAVNLDTYSIDKSQNVGADGTNAYIVYREMPKATTTGKVVDENDATQMLDGYYGKFVGYSYYVGKLSEKVPLKDNTGNTIVLDTISSLKFDKILDYIDTNLEYEQKTKAEELTNRLWSKITSRELVGLVSHYKDLRLNIASVADEDLPKVTNIDGVEYKSMVVSVDDRNVDPGDPNDKGDVKNADLSRFLLPKVSLVGMNGDDETARGIKDAEGKTTYSKYTGSILLDVSKVLAAGSDDDDKTYENIAEIVQFTTLNGRRTNFATTIGNAHIQSIKEKLENKEPPFEGTTGNNSGSIEFITASVEPDTSATETITLIPPTGLMRSRRPIVSIMETAKAGVEIMSMTGLVVAIIAVAVVGVLFVVRKYQKRRIK